MSIWIPALHTGITQSRNCTKADRYTLTSRIFKGGAEDTELENSNFEMLL